MMNIVYCKECNPKKILAVGACHLPTRHYIGETPLARGEVGDPADWHTDCGVITVDDDPQTETETSDEYLIRLTTANQAQFV